MFAAEANRTELRQGDVCALDFVPNWDLRRTYKQLDPSGTLASLAVPAYKSVTRTDEGPLVVVCSQCCDIENAKGRIGVAVAPVRPAPLSRTDTARWAELEASWQPSDGRWSFFHLFPLLLPPTGSAEESLVVVDWSALTSVGPHDDAVALLLNGKALQLDDERRAAFRRKLGLSFGLPPTEDQARN